MAIEFTSSHTSRWQAIRLTALVTALAALVVAVYSGALGSAGALPAPPLPELQQVDDAAVRAGGAGGSDAPGTLADAAVAGPDQAAVADSRSITPEDAPSVSAAAVAAPVTDAGRWTAEGIVFIDGASWDDASRRSIDAALAMLPAGVRASLGNRALGELQVLVNADGRTISGRQPYGRAANFFSTNSGDNELVLYPGQSSLTVLHELGHAFNLRRSSSADYVSVLLDPEMQGFMAAAGWRVLTPPDQLRGLRDQRLVSFAYDGQPVWPDLSHGDPLEDFANSFALYFVSPGELQSRSPERYAWFKQNLR